MIGIWGVVNVTPDSFSDGGRYTDPARAVAHGQSMLAAGATVLDVGGESTRPGAQRVGVEVEQQRIAEVMTALASAGAVVSVDTLNASTALVAVEAGAQIVNDVSGGLADPDMLHAVASTNAEFVIGHWRGPSADMYARADYANAPHEVAAELRSRIDAAERAGIAPERIIVDPGIGFAKTAPQNWHVLRDLSAITALGYRVLVGTSRKRLLAEALCADDTETVDETRRDTATAITSVLAQQAGAWAVRVHNVQATHDALLIADAWEGTDATR